MDTASKSGKMDLNTMDNGSVIKQTAMELSFMLMVIFTRDSGLMIKLMDMVLISMPMELHMLVSGLKINSMDMVLRNGLIAQSMRVNIKTARNMEMDS